MANPLTRDQLIVLGLKQSGNETLAVTARDWLNDILDFVYRMYEWPFLFTVDTSVTIVVSDTTIALPADFVDVWGDRALKIAGGSPSTESVMNLVPVSTYRDYQIGAVSPGRPDFYFIDYKSSLARFAPASDGSYTTELYYRYLPDRLSADEAPVFPDAQILIDGIYVVGLQHEDDARYDKALDTWLKALSSYAEIFGLVLDDTRRRSKIEEARLVLSASRK